MMGIFMPVFSEAEKTMVAIAAASLAAGASERFVRSIVAKINEEYAE